MLYLFTATIPGRGQVLVSGPRLSGKTNPLTDQELLDAVSPANLPVSLLGLKMAADAPYAGMTLDDGQKAEVLTSIRADVMYDAANLLPDMIASMPDKDFCRVPALSIELAAAGGGITAQQADDGFARLAQLTVDGHVSGPVHPLVLAKIKAL